MLQKLVVDVLAVGGEDGASADQAADDGERRLQNWQAERNYRDRDGDDGGRFLRAFESQGAEHKSDEEAAGVAQENRGRIEVVTQEAEDRAGQGDGHDRDQRRPIQQRDDEGHQSREQGGSGGQAVEAVDQVERVGDGENPENGDGQSNDTRATVIAENDGDIDDPQAAHEQHGGGDALHRELEIRADAVDIVVHAQQKNERSRERGWSAESSRKTSRCRRGLCRTQSAARPMQTGKGKEDGNAAQTRQGTGMQMTFLRGNRDPTVGSSEIAHVPRQYEGGQQRQNKHPEENSVNETTSAGRLRQRACQLELS